MGRRWVHVIAHSTEVELVGLVDLDVGAAERAVAAAGLSAVPMAASLDELIGRVPVDAVITVTVPQAHAGTAVWDGDHQPVAQTVDGASLPAVAGSGPEEIAGALAEFVAAVRDGGVPSGEIHRNVMSLAMVEGAIRSARTGRRVILADLLDEAYQHALTTERRPRLRAALAAWASAHEVVANGQSLDLVHHDADESMKD
jgi:predicted dehydrogenase